MRLAAASVVVLALLAVPAAADIPTTKDQAVALANAINLTRADMPGYKATPPSQTPADKRANAEISKCAGKSPTSEAIANVRSSDFDRTDGIEDYDAQSAVTVVSDAERAQA